MITPSPKRLLEQGDSLAELLERAADGYEQGLDPNRALLRFRTKKKPAPPLGGWLAFGAVAAAGAALLLARPWQAGATGAELLVTAEAPTAKSPRAAAQLDDSSKTQPRAVKPEAKPGRALAPSLPADARKPAPPASSAAETNSASPAKAEEACLAHARAGEPRLAAACFSAQAKGSGLSAQVALYELSRLQRDALGEPAAALGSLTQYLERFPSGSLNGEARFSRLELLARLGRTKEAVTASSEFLSSPFGRERAAEVHLFRGNLFLRGAGSAAEAVREYRAALGAAGRVGDDAAYQLAVALEATGAKAEAQSAYERYLAQGSGRHRSLATARLAELSK